MEKRRKWGIGISLLLLFVLCVGAAVYLFADINTGEAYYRKGSTEIRVELTVEEVQTIRQLLKSREFAQFGSDGVRCGFSEHCRMTLGRETILLTRDDCDAIYVKERNIVYRISSQANETIRTLLTTYGFEFPYGYDNA